MGSSGSPIITTLPASPEAQRDIHQRATDDLADAGLEGIHLSFYLTSIYDHSIFEVCAVCECMLHQECMSR